MLSTQDSTVQFGNLRFKKIKYVGGGVRALVSRVKDGDETKQKQGGLNDNKTRVEDNEKEDEKEDEVYVCPYSLMHVSLLFMHVSLCLYAYVLSL